MRIKPNSSGTSQSKQAAVLPAVCLAIRKKDDLHARQPVKQSGFTLLEVMIVMVIMAVMAAIAIPAFSSWREKEAVQSAAQSLMAHLKQARTLALAENRSVSITFTSKSYTFDAATSSACIKAPPNSADTAPCKNIKINLSQFSGNLIIKKKTSNNIPSTFTFSSRGTINKGNVQLAAGAYSKTITVNGIGRAYFL